MAGWGQGDGTLIAVNVTVVEDAVCDAGYQSIWPGLGIFEDYELCAGDETADICSYDDGGPLMCNGVMAGIAGNTGLTVGCGYDDERPGIYTEVAAFSNWIVETVEANEPTTTITSTTTSTTTKTECPTRPPCSTCTPCPEPTTMPKTECPTRPPCPAYTPCPEPTTMPIITSTTSATVRDTATFFFAAFSSAVLLLV